jgi:hypothetical protein
MGRVHLSPKKPMANRLAKRGDVFRKGDALEIPTRVAETKRRICVESGEITPASINRSTPKGEGASQMIKGPRIGHTTAIMVTIEMEMAVTGVASFRPTRTQI